LPPLAAVNSILTATLDRAGWYRPIKKYIVPWQARMVAVVVKPLGIESRIVSDSSLASMYFVKDAQLLPVDLAWNCIGWQSLLLFGLSLVAGMGGSFSWFSRTKCVVFGLAGTILMNVMRMSFLAVGIYYGNSFIVSIVHDYFAALMTLLWLIVFWWFSYTFILD
jgi:exosortase/archaeosortase family protein